MNPVNKAIVIGAGRSFYETKLLDQLSKSDFKGHVVVAERIAYNVLQVLDPRLYRICVVTSEAMRTIDLAKQYMSFYDAIRPYERFIRILVSCVTDQDMALSLRTSFPYVSFFHRKFKECITKLDPYAPTILCGGNAGLTCWNIARQLLGCDQIATIGLDFESYKNDLGNDSWNTELQLTKAEILNYHRECSTFNLSPYGRLDGEGILRCTLDEFIKDSYDRVNNSQVEF